MEWEKKKVLIITLWDDGNLGNRLQNYALQQVLLNLGCEVKTGVIDKYNIQKNYERKRKIKLILAKLGVKKYYQVLDKVIQRKAGTAFNDAYIRNREYIGSFDDAFDKDFAEYDYLIAGSDQIWHWWHREPLYHEPNELKFYGLQFVPENKRIVYAGSFGFDKAPEKLIEEYKEILTGYAAISSREDSGTAIIKTLTGRIAPVVLDPTLMLKAEQWAGIEKQPLFVTDEKYILVYALGEKSETFKAAIEQEKNSSGCQAINVRTKGKNGRELPVGPSEFIYLVHHADAVLTDSFHGTAFSLIFHKKVIVFQRSGVDMSGRIRSLAKTVGLSDRKDDKGIILSVDQSADYAEIDMRLNMEKERSMTYLKNSLSGGGTIE